MKFGKKILLGILFIQLIGSLVFMYLGHYQYSTMLDMMIQKKENRTFRIVNNTFEQITKEYTNYGNDLLSNPEIIEAFSTRDRKKLYDLSLPIYENLKKQNKYLYIMHFHTMDTHSFLRVHKPEKFGDDLSDIRPIILKTNKLQKMQTGLEVGKFGLYYRVTFPVFKEDTYIGAFEFGIDAKYLMSRISMQDGFTPALLVAKEAVASIYKYSKTVDEYFSPLTSEYVLINYKSHTKDDILIEDLLDNRIINNSNYIETINDKTHLIFRGQPVNDYKNSPLGHFVFIEDINYFMNTMVTLRWSSVFITFLLLIIIVGFIYKLINRYTSELHDINKELNEKARLLFEEKEKVIVTLKSIGDAVVITDLNGHITFLNEIAEKITEKKTEEVEGLHVDDVLNLWNMKSGKKIKTPIHDVLYNNLTKLISNGTKLISKSGKEYIISDSAAPVKDRDGKILGTVLVFQDDTQKHKADKALRDQKELYELVFKNSVSGVLIIDIEENRFIDCNEPAIEILKCDSKEDVLDLHPADLSPEYQPDGMLSSEKSDIMNASAVTNGSHTFEWLHLTKTKEEIWIEVSLTPVEIDGKKVLHVVWKDIAVRKKAEETLRDLKERMELALLGSKDAVWDWNIVTNEVYFSPRWKEIIGYSDSELPNEFSSWEDRVHPDDMEPTMVGLQENIDGKTEYYEGVHRMKHKDGHWVWILDRGKTVFDENGKAIRMIGTHTDVSADKELELLSLERGKILDNSMNEIFIFDAQNYKFLYMNKGAQENIGYSLSEMLNMTPLDIKPMIVLEDFINLLKPITEDKQESIQYSTIHQRKDGSKYNVDIYLQPTYYEGHHAYVAFILDVTQKKELENRLLIQSRMAQMGEMISMIAHQWRQPLTAISATALNMQLQINLEEFDLDTKHGQEEQSRHLLEDIENINGFIKNLSATIDDFRNFYKPNKESKSVQLEEVIGKAIKIIKLSLETDEIEILEEYNDNDYLQLYDNELMQVILNIIKNAQDNFKDKEIEDKYIKIKTENKMISICDNGGGISVSILEKIFEPYFSSKDESSGTGLGLYMSKIIIEEHHNGKLIVENIDDGVCFRIELNEVAK